MQLMYPSATTSNIARAGVDMENLGAANDNNKKMGIEGCASTGTNWRIVSADGSSRTQIDASVALVQAQADSYAIENSPGVAAKFSYNGGTYVDKTNTLPGSGAVTKSNVLMAGVQTSNTTAKTLYVWGVYFTGFAHSTGWVH
jgi:hypothetical protein